MTTGAEACIECGAQTNDGVQPCNLCQSEVGLMQTPRSQLNVGAQLLQMLKDYREGKRKFFSYSELAELRGEAAQQQHDSDCSTNNRGVPEMLGPCDCSMAARGEKS